MVPLSLVLLSGLMTLEPAQTPTFDALAPLEVRTIPGEWIKPAFGDLLSYPRGALLHSGSMLISEDGERLYVGTTRIGLTRRELRTFALYESILIPGFPIVGDWQDEINDPTWTGEHPRRLGLHTVGVLSILYEPTPDSLVIAHRTGTTAIGVDHPITKSCNGVSRVEFGSTTATKNTSLLRFYHRVGIDEDVKYQLSNQIGVAIRDAGSDWAFVQTRGTPGNSFLFWEGRFAIAPSIDTESYSILAIDSGQGIVVIEPHRRSTESPDLRRQTWFLVLNWPNTVVPRLESFILSPDLDSPPNLRAATLPGGRVLLSATPSRLRADGSGPIAEVFNYVGSSSSTIGPYSIMATARSGRWVLLASADWDEPAYLVRF